MRYNIHPRNVFSNVNKIASIPIRAFAWKYFQGALPFDHKAECECGESILTHKHIFFECERTSYIRDPPDWTIRMLYMEKDFQ